MLHILLTVIGLLNPNGNGLPGTRMCDGMHDIFFSKTRTYTSSAAPRMIDTYFRPSPTHGFTVYITERSRIYKSSPIPWALYYRPPSPAPSRVRPRDVAQHADTRTYESSPIRRALYYRLPPAPSRVHPRDGAQHADTRTIVSSPIRRALYYTQAYFTRT